MSRKMLSVNLVVIFSLITLSAIQANASLLVDLRFPFGFSEHNIPISPFDTDHVYTVEVWAQLRGTNTTGTDDSLRSLTGSVQTSQAAIRAIDSGTSGVTGNSAAGPVFSNVLPLGQTGTAQNLTADGVQDWGTTASNNGNTIKYASTLNDGLDLAFYNSPGVTAHLLDEGLANAGVEFLVGRLSITIHATDIHPFGEVGETTFFNWVKGTGAAPATHSEQIDGSASAETNNSTYLASAVQNSVQFSLEPEPSTGVLFGLALPALGMRRWRIRM